MSKADTHGKSNRILSANKAELWALPAIRSPVACPAQLLINSGGNLEKGLKMMVAEKTWKNPSALRMAILAIVTCVFPLGIVYAQDSKDDNRSISSVAIIRTEEVARQVGWDVESEKVINREKSVKQADIARQRELLQADIDTKRKQYGDNPTPGQQENLRAMEQQMQAQSEQLARRAQESLQRVRGDQLRQFRGEVGPVIMKLASERRFTVVLDAALSNVFFFDRSVDITDAVVEELKRRKL